jgi:hypothetical protein
VRATPLPAFPSLRLFFLLLRRLLRFASLRSPPADASAPLARSILPPARGFHEESPVLGFALPDRSAPVPRLRSLRDECDPYLLSCQARRFFFLLIC